MGIVKGFLSFINSVLGKLLFFLPDSPFTGFINALDKIPYIKNINYYLPFYECLSILQAWCIAIAVFYVYQIILRWVKAIS